MDTYEKLDETTIKITRTEVKEEQVTIDELLLARENKQKQIADVEASYLINQDLLSSELRKIDDKIVEAGKVGVVQTEPVAEPVIEEPVIKEPV